VLFKWAFIVPIVSFKCLKCLIVFFVVKKITSSGVPLWAIVWDENGAANQIKAFVPLFIHIVDQYI